MWFLKWRAAGFPATGLFCPRPARPLFPGDVAESRQKTIALKVSISEEFCRLSVDQLTEIISHDELDVKEEMRVWEAVQERDAVYEPQSRAVHQLWLPSRPSSCRDHDCYQ
ncbi:uncharacterized protein LOC144909017 [Branchiostoma floridae x Branchiostoma belcheri]